MDSDPLSSFFRSYFPIILGKCTRALGDGEEAADVAQEVFVRLWQSPVAERPADERLRWVYKVSTRLAVDRLRARRARQGMEVPSVASHEFAVTTPRLDAALCARQQLARLARDTPADELEIAVLIRLDDMSQEEAAQVLGISERSVRRRLVRFEARLQRWRART